MGQGQNAKVKAITLEPKVLEERPALEDYIAANNAI